MKKINTTLLSVTLLMSASSSFAENNFLNSEVLPYFRLDSGWATFEKVKGSGSQGSNSKLKSKTNPVVGAGIGLGINFGDKVRSDITWSHHINPTLKTDNSSYKVKRKPVIDAYFLNIYYELGNLVSIFNPYLGAGAGVAAVKDKLIVSNINNNGAQSTSEVISRKNNFAYKFIIGSAFNLNDNIKFDMSYSFNDYGKTKSRTNALNNQIGKTHYKAHIISAGLRFGM